MGRNRSNRFGFDVGADLQTSSTDCFGTRTMTAAVSVCAARIQGKIKSRYKRVQFRLI